MAPSWRMTKAPGRATASQKKEVPTPTRREGAPTTPVSPDPARTSGGRGTLARRREAASGRPCAWRRRRIGRKPRRRRLASSLHPGNGSQPSTMPERSPNRVGRVESRSCQPRRVTDLKRGPAPSRDAAQSAWPPRRAALAACGRTLARRTASRRGCRGLARPSRACGQPQLVRSRGLAAKISSGRTRSHRLRPPALRDPPAAASRPR